MKKLFAVFCLIACTTSYASTAALAEGAPAVSVSVRASDIIDADDLQDDKDIRADNLKEFGCKYCDDAPSTTDCTVTNAEQPTEKEKLLRAPVFTVAPYPER